MIVGITFENPIDVGVNAVVNGVGIKIKGNVTFLIWEDGVCVKHYVITAFFFSNMQRSALNNLVTLLQIG